MFSCVSEILSIQLASYCLVSYLLSTSSSEFVYLVEGNGRACFLNLEVNQDEEIRDEICEFRGKLA